MFLTLVSVCLLGIVTGADERYFTAAVLEKPYVHGEAAATKDDIVRENSKLYLKAAEVAASKGVDIMVFPEYGLFPSSRNRSFIRPFAEHIPDPNKVKTNPCNEGTAYRNRPILLILSCIAREYGMYVAANMADHQPCSDDASSCDATSVDGCPTGPSCPEDGSFVYNSDVVFDREGNLIARYHKNHLYFEVWNTPQPFEMVKVQTDIGVLGIVSCFDSVFKEAAKLSTDYGIDTLLFPTYWFDDILPLTAAEWQQGMALGNKVNILAADGHHPDTGTVGSGIYSRKHGALTYTYNPDGKSRLLIAKVPRGDSTPPQPGNRYIVTEDEVFEEPQQDGVAFPANCHVDLVGPARHKFEYRCYKTQFTKYALKKLTDPKGSEVVCHNEFCCSVVYSADRMDEEYYIAVFNGTNHVRGHFKWAEENCLLVRCDSFDGESCVMIPKNAHTVFDHVEIKATFTSTAHVYPTVSVDNYRLAPKSEFEVSKHDRKTVLSFRSGSRTPLLKAGFMARVYDRDPPYVPFYKY